MTFSGIYRISIIASNGMCHIVSAQLRNSNVVVGLSQLKSRKIIYFLKKTQQISVHTNCVYFSAYVVFRLTLLPWHGIAVFVEIFHGQSISHKSNRNSAYQVLKSNNYNVTAGQQQLYGSCIKSH